MPEPKTLPIEFAEPDLSSEELQLISMFDARSMGCKILLRYDPEQGPTPFTVTRSYPKPHSITKNRMEVYPTLDLAKAEYVDLHEAEVQSLSITPDEHSDELSQHTLDELQVMLSDRQNQLTEIEDSLTDGSAEDPEEARHLVKDIKQEIEEMEEAVKTRILLTKGAEMVTDGSVVEAEVETDEVDLSI